MTEQDKSYRPRSPDFSTFQPTIPSVTQPTYQFGGSLPQRTSYDASPFFNPHYQQSPVAPNRVPQQYVPPYSDDFDSDMARRSSRLARAVEVAPVQVAPVHVTPLPEPKFMEPVLPDEPPELPTPSLAAGVEVKTKFPVARIKRIMQADEDVGKVAQVTPIAVSKALELFMISLVTKAAKEAKDRNSKRVTASHLKQAVAKDEVLDFLADIIAKVPDQPTGRKHEDDGSDQNEQPKRKRGGRRPKDDSD
ncbi:Putative Class 2 transcription repressor NC2 [Aspergillus calidoustus]|uniref:NCT transcriptional regulatory complex subunit A n=1 Tax=Aspergillus calidoustus TaxID=454130 RepID=A0A0U5FRF7_ASPCI|nr:Putative Class 2 transcription repressor NC2 [Aspergillus calidoustus]